MPVPDIFADGDPSEAKLAAYFEEMYDFLLEEGVPEDRLPGPWHMLSRMVKCLDPDLFTEWLEAYVSVESEVTVESSELEEDSSSSNPQPRPKPQRRPDYLRAIEDQNENTENVQEEEVSQEDGS